MKTSLLISSIAALCLLVTFAEAPRRLGEEKINLSSNENISILSVNRVTMLSGVEITADRKKEPEIMASDATYLDDAELLPEAALTDFSYLKFKISDFISETEFTSDETIELPENEIVNSVNPVSEAVASEFEYLRFDVNNYIINSLMDDDESAELPLPESGNNDKSYINLMESTSEINYIKFDVNKFYNFKNPSSEENFELPEK